MKKALRYVWSGSVTGPRTPSRVDQSNAKTGDSESAENNGVRRVDELRRLGRGLHGMSEQSRPRLSGRASYGLHCSMMQLSGSHSMGP
jgi:hypothetical protein